MKPLTKNILWLTLFSIAMGYLETAVVVYLRKLYYPNGFDFPLLPVTNDIAVAEFWREFATIIMLIGVGILAGKNKLQRFVFFLYSFAIWDLFYYVFLKLLLNWPASLFTWDILFLIPVPWVGPVIAPCIISLLMILLMTVVVYFQEKGKKVDICFAEWMLLIFGSIIAIVSFMWDYITYLTKEDAASTVWTLKSNNNLFDEVKNYIPETFNWGLFLLGQSLIFFAILLLYLRLKKQKNE